MSEISFAGRVAIVTGAGGGLGKPTRSNSLDEGPRWSSTTSAETSPARTAAPRWPTTWSPRSRPPAVRPSRTTTRLPRPRGEEESSRPRSTPSAASTSSSTTPATSERSFHGPLARVRRVTARRARQGRVPRHSTGVRGHAGQRLRPHRLHVLGGRTLRLHSAGELRRRQGGRLRPRECRRPRRKAARHPGQHDPPRREQSHAGRHECGAVRRNADYPRTRRARDDHRDGRVPRQRTEHRDPRAVLDRAGTLRPRLHGRRTRWHVAHDERSPPPTTSPPTSNVSATSRATRSPSRWSPSSRSSRDGGIGGRDAPLLRRHRGRIRNRRGHRRPSALARASRDRDRPARQ